MVPEPDYLFFLFKAKAIAATEAAMNTTAVVVLLPSPVVGVEETVFAVTLGDSEVETSAGVVSGTVVSTVVSAVVASVMVSVVVSSVVIVVASVVSSVVSSVVVTSRVTSVTGIPVF